MAGIEKVIFMNMCMVYDKEGNVVALDKVGEELFGNDISRRACGAGGDLQRIGDPGNL